MIVYSVDTQLYIIVLLIIQVTSHCFSRNQRFSHVVVFVPIATLNKCTTPTTYL